MITKAFAAFGDMVPIKPSRTAKAKKGSVISKESKGSRPQTVLLRSALPFQSESDGRTLEVLDVTDCASDFCSTQGRM